MNLGVVKRAIGRHLRMKSLCPYEQVLEEVRSRGDVWMTSQGAYMAWWEKRQRALLEIAVSQGEFVAKCDLENAVLERFPHEFLASDRGSCPNTFFSGKLQLTIDVTLERKHLLIDALQREGITNLTVGKEGEFLLSHKLDDILERMEGHLRRRELSDYDQTILSIRDTVATLLAGHGLPLVRIWYHPRIHGKIIKAVFSPSYDVDRAITNLPKILQLEQRFGASSSVYVRVSHPFYQDKDIQMLASVSPLVDIALHAELASHARHHSSELVTAQTDKAHLERVVDRPVSGVSIHGGELIRNSGRTTWRAIEGCAFLYGKSHRCLPYYFPCRRLNERGQLGTTYSLYCQFRDLDLAHTDYARAFYKEAMRSLERVLQHSGVFVMDLHPEYFGPFAYLLNPRNFARLVRFAPTYLTRVLRLAKDQERLNASS